MSEPLSAITEDRPLPPRVAREASRWLVLFMSGEATEAERERWRRWREADPDHERAWRHIEAINAGLKDLPPGLGRALAHGGLARRQVLRSLVALTGVAGGGWLVMANRRHWPGWSADYHAGVGEQRDIRLADGSDVLLNTDTLLDVAYAPDQRRLLLRRGEIMVSTAKSVSGPPLQVVTGDGAIRPLGTRFSVWQQGGGTRVAVFDGMVELSPARAGAVRVLSAGSMLTFTRDGFGQEATAGLAQQAWTRGQLIADDMRLADFLDELARYRPGLIRHDPAVADLRLSGVFPLRDTDQVLDELSRLLPVEIGRRSRYWVSVVPRAGTAAS